VVLSGSVRRAGPWWLVAVAAGECVVTDLADRVVQAVQGISDPLHGRVMGQLDRGLQAEADVQQAAGHPVQELAAAAGLVCRGRGACQVARSAPGRSPVTSRITARMRRPVAVGIGLRLTRTGNVLRSLRRPASRARSAIGRAAGSHPAGGSSSCDAGGTPDLSLVLHAHG
jgi:hypothetical protein